MSRPTPRNLARGGLLPLVGGLLLLAACQSGGARSPVAQQPPYASAAAPVSAAASTPAPRTAYAAAPAPVAYPAMPPVTSSAPLPAAGAGRHVPGFAQTNASFDALLARAASSGRPALVYIGADWCGCCSRFDREVLSQGRVAERIRAFPASYYDSQTPAGRAVADRFDVHSYPTVLLVDGGGRVVKNVLSLQSAESFLAQLSAY